jgi:hypothetical protein
MTYFEMVNEVLIRMREMPISLDDGGVNSETLDPQQRLVCKFVNDARTFVERAHTWNACRKVWIIDLAHGVSRYNLRGGTEQSTVSFIRYDDGPILQEVHQNEISSRPSHQAKPLWFAPSWVSNDAVAPVEIPPTEYNVSEYGHHTAEYGRDTRIIRPPAEQCVQIEIWPKPDNTFGGTGDVYEYTVAQYGLGMWAAKGKMLHAYGYIQPYPLKDNDDPIIVPDDPVMHFALAYALSERGEAGGGGAQQAFALAKQYLSDAISWDANNSRGEYIWEAV